MTKYILVLLFGTTLSACSYPLSLVTDPAAQSPSSAGNFNTANIDPKLQSAALNILNQNCSSCHTQSSGPANVYGLADVKHLFSSGLLVAGDPSHSPLFLSIQAGSMPPKGPLSSADQDILREFIISAGATGGTDYQPAPAAKPEPTFTYIKNEILGPKCTGCHNQKSAADGYAFDTYSYTLKAVNKKSPQESKLYTVCAKGEMPPRPKTPLNSEELGLLLTWIENGAQDN